MAEREEVTAGKEGWLFLTGGSNDTRLLYENSPQRRRQSRRWASLIINRGKRLKTRNVRYVHLGVPDKLSIYGDDLGLERSSAPLRMLGNALKHKAGLAYFVNPTTHFREHRASIPLYWKTDSHWTPWGCFAAYQRLCSKLGVAARDDLLSRPFTEVELLLDLAAKLGNGRTEIARFYHFVRDAARTEANGLVAFKEAHNLLNEVGLHVGSRVIFRNTTPIAVPWTVVLFGDSFAEYRSHLLTGMLAETFRELHFIWSADLDYDYIAKISPDIVITELAERFLSRLPTDIFNSEEFARRQLENYQARLPVGTGAKA